MYGIACVVGPLLGGVFTDKLTWRWYFWINLPIGGATFAMILFFLDELRNITTNPGVLKAKFLQLDLPGTRALFPAVVCLLLALQSGGTRWVWNSGPVIVLFILGFILFGVFIALQVWKGDNATLPPRVLMQRSISSATLFSLCVSASLQVNFHSLVAIY
jgi:MFS family permease